MLDFDDPVRSFNRCKSIDELYEEVNGCDLVITNDIALATALNARIDRPLIGKFAMTPREIAAKNAIRVLGRMPMSDTELIRSISEETGLDPIFVHGEVENIRSIRYIFKDVWKYLHGDSKKVYGSYIKHPTIEAVMDDFEVAASDDYLKCERIAVIDGPTFNQLDRMMNPLGKGVCEVIEVDSYTNEGYHIDAIHVVGSDRQLANNVVALIDPKKATDYAIVVNSESPIVNSVKAALYRKDIAFVNELELRDMGAIRTITSFIDLSLNFDTLRVSDVRAMFASLGSKVVSKLNRRLLNKVKDDELDPAGIVLRAFMKDVRNRTFLEVADLCLKKEDRELALSVLDEIKIKDEHVSTKLYNYLAYMVNNVKDLKFDDRRPISERKGVLIADCNRSCHIDRPVVFYLGMGEDWNYSAPGKRYMEFDREIEEAKNAFRMQILLQQGQERIYLVNMNKDGKEARPSSVFNHLFESPPGHFKDICDRVVFGRWQGDHNGEGFTKDETLKHRADGFRTNFSKSSYANYLECPHKFELGKLIDFEDNDSKEMGNLVHYFAELYACYPDFVNDMGLETFEKDILDEYSGLSYPALTEVDRCRIHVNLLNTKAMLDELEVRLPLDTPIDRDREVNRLFIRYGMMMKSSYFERWVSDDEYHIEGRMDLIWGGTIYDFKSGKIKTPEEYLDHIRKYRDHQAYFYLALSRNIPERNGRFVLYYTSSNEDDALSGNIDIWKNMLEIILEDEVTYDLLMDCLVREAIKDGHTRFSNRGTFERFYSNIQKKMEEKNTPNISFDKTLVAWLDPTEEEKLYLKDVVFKCIKNYIKLGQIVMKNRIITPRYKLDEFLEEVDENHARMMIESRTEFPASKGANCSDCDYRVFCTKLKRSGEGGEGNGE